MKVVIIGSVGSSKKDISYVREHFETLGFEVIDPITEDEKAIKDGLSLSDVMSRYINFILDVDLIVVVPKTKKDKGGFDDAYERTFLFGTQTTYEMTMCKKLNKPVLIWDFNKEV